MDDSPDPPPKAALCTSTLLKRGVWGANARLYSAVAVRTGGKGMGGISLLLIEKTMPGVECKRMDCMGVWASGTSFITFDSVKAGPASLVVSVVYFSHTPPPRGYVFV